MSTTANLPSLRGHWLLGNLPEYRRDPLGFVQRAALHGDLVRVKMGPRTVHLVASPELAHHVLVERQHNYGKQTMGFAMLRLVLGEGLLTSEGTFWKRQRRIANPEFTRERVASFEGIMLEETESLLQRWEPAASRGEPLDVSQEMMRLALRIVGRALLGAVIGPEVEEVDRALRALLGQAMDRITSVVRLPLGLPTPKNRQFREALSALDRVVYGFIEKRRRGEGDRTDLLWRLMNARDPETGETMDDRQLRDEVMTMFLAGHETTANALTWTWYLLSQNPAARKRLEEELESVLMGRPPRVEDLPRLPYALAVLKESMRLYPPAWMISRNAIEEDRLGGYRIPAGAILLVSPYVMHRHPALWERAESFEPERFLGEEASKLPRHAYFPFGAGPRQCIGKDFALQEAHLVLCRMAQSMRLDLLPGHPVVAQPMITLRPRHGMKMTVHAR
jgi:cytochrome P450